MPGADERYACDVQELQPQLEGLELHWFRLHTLTGADTSEEVVNFWQGRSYLPAGLICTLIAQAVLCVNVNSIVSCRSMQAAAIYWLCWFGCMSA